MALLECHCPLTKQWCLINFWKGMPRIKPRASGWEAPMLPLCYAAPLEINQRYYLIRCQFFWRVENSTISTDSKLTLVKVFSSNFQSRQLVSFFLHRQDGVSSPRTRLARTWRQEKKGFIILQRSPLGCGQSQFRSYSEQQKQPIFCGNKKTLTHLGLFVLLETGLMGFIVIRCHVTTVAWMLLWMNNSVLIEQLFSSHE